MSDARHKMYAVWEQMKSRCYNENHSRYDYYGGRGIDVEDSWHKFDWFYADMADSYREGLTLERIDNNKGYSKSNCKWTTYEENNQNRCNVVASPESVKQIRQLHKEGYLQNDIAEKFSMSTSTINRIVRRLTCRNVP